MPTTDALGDPCASHPWPRLRFRFDTGTGYIEKCLPHAILHPRVLKTALLTSAVVGTLLTAINQGNTMAAGDFPADLAWKIPLTYSVPYSVATFSALRITRVRD